MASFSLRSGGRRLLLPHGAQSMIRAGAATQARAPTTQARAPTTARSSSLPYFPKVDPTRPGNHSGALASIGCGTATLKPQGDTGIPITVALLAPSAGGSATTFRSVASISGCSRSRSSASHHPQVDSGSPIALGILDAVSGGSHTFRGVASTCHPHQQTIAGAATCFRRRMSSMASPCDSSSGKEGNGSTCNINKEDQYWADDSRKGKPEVCKYNENAVITRLDKIGSDVIQVREKVDGLGGKVEQTVEECTNLRNELELLKRKSEGSGDWTSVRIRGKNLNWLSVASAAWELFKANFK